MAVEALAKEGILRVALAQINPTVGDFKGNISTIIRETARAQDVDADIVMFPELAVCGYPPEDLLLRPSFLQDNRAALTQVEQASAGMIVVVGFADTADGRVYNAAALLSDACLAGVYHKVELPNYGVFDEKRYFSRGTEPFIFEIDQTRVAMTICEDLWIEADTTEQSIKENGVGLVLNISASPFHAGKLAVRRNVLAAFARRTKTYVCYDNLVGGQDELVFDGGSMVIDHRGGLVAAAKRFENDMLVVDIEVGDIAESREPAGRTIELESRSHTDRKVLPTSRAPELGRLDEVYEALVLGTRDYTRKNGFEKVVIGLSGGIDSSLTAAIAVEALGQDNVVCVTMPSRYTSSETLSDAELSAKNLETRLITVPIETIFSVYLDVLHEPFGPGEPGIEVENLQARIRGNILMALSNRFGWLVLTTGNKSETAVGYCTLYGDMAGGFAVIKDVPKTLVYEIAEHVNEKTGRDLIPRSVLDRPPTAELRPNQKDEDSLPCYALLDPILRAYVEEDKAPADVVTEGFEPEIVNDVVRMVDRNEYKRRQAPPGIKITPKAFGRDRRLPMTNRYSSHSLNA